MLLPALLPFVESVAPVLSLVPFFDLRVVSVSVLVLLLVVLDVPDVLGLVVDEPGLVVEGDVEEPCPGVAWANVSGETATASAIANTAFVIMVS